MNKLIFLIFLLLTFNVFGNENIHTIRGEWSNCRYEGDGVIGFYTSIFDNLYNRIDIILFSTEKDCDSAIRKPDSMAIIRSTFTFDGLLIENKTQNFSIVFFRKSYQTKFKNTKLCKTPLSKVLKDQDCMNDNLPEFKDIIEKIVEIRNEKPRKIFNNGFGRIHEEKSIPGFDMFATNIYKN